MRKFFVSLAVLTVPMIFGNVLYAQDLSNKLNMLEIVISNLVARVEALEKRVNALEKNLSGSVSKVPKKEIPSTESPKPSLTNGFEDVGSGFFIRNVRFIPFGINVLFTGEIANMSEKNYRFAKFKLEVYDERDLLIKKEEFTVPDIPKDNVKSFEVMLVGVDAGLINKYMIKAIE